MQSRVLHTARTFLRTNTLAKVDRHAVSFVTGNQFNSHTTRNINQKYRGNVSTIRRRIACNITRTMSHVLQTPLAFFMSSSSFLAVVSPRSRLLVS